MTVFSQGNRPLSVNPEGEAGSRSLTGSYVAFDPSVGGDAYYLPGGGTYNFVFKAYSYSPDWEWVYSIWLHFPDGWVVNNISAFGTPACDNGYFGSFNWGLASSNTVYIDHMRYHSSGGDQCTAHYMVNVTVPVAATVDAYVSWYWDGDGWGGTPHRPCSDDGYTPGGQSACDEMVNPRAMIPMFGALDCLENSIFSQPPNNFWNAYFSDESTYWGNQRILENFFGLTMPINGMTFWGILYAPSTGDCYTGGSDDFVITFYQDNAGAVGTMVQSFTINLTPLVTGSTVTGAVILRYDLLLPTNVYLTDGWVNVYRKNPSNENCAFAWLNTVTGDDIFAWNQFGGSINYDNYDNMAFCLAFVPTNIPLSNWALYSGIFLILAFIVFRFRRMV